MSKITVTLNGTEFQAEEGSTVLEAATQAGVGLAHACFGNSICTTCRVNVIEGGESLSPKHIKETVSLNYHLNFDEPCRLACQAKLTGPGPVTLEAPKPFRWLAPKNRAPKKKSESHSH